LFTCDITKPFIINRNSKKLNFHLITAWEMLEHLRKDDLKLTFRNIINNLAIGGYFIASTSSTSDIKTGIELHQIQWSNKKWREFIAAEDNRLKAVNLPIKYYQYVRYDQKSFLTYRKI